MAKQLNKILLVDDDQDTNMIVSTWIQREKLAKETVVALNGEEALQYLRKNTAPDLILLDINMPKMNGWEFFDQYKKEFSINPGTIVIMVTVSINPADKERADREKLEFVNKPLKPEILSSLIAKNFGEN